jgi:hypothetical protein
LANLKRRHKPEDFGEDETIILGWILKKQDEKLWTGCIWLRIGPSGGPL